MGLSSKGQAAPPPAPDPGTVAAAQAAANVDAARETAKLNQFNQISPFGSLTFTGDIGEPGRTATTAFTPQGQQTFDIQQALGQQLSQLATGRAGQIPTDPFSFDGLPPPAEAGPEARLRVEQALRGRLEPQFNRRQEALDTRLANQGITQGSEAFKNAQGDLNRARTDTNLAITAAGGQEQQLQFNLADAQRRNALQESLTERGLPFNELAAFLQGSPAVGVPNFGQPTQVGISPTDVLGATAISQQARNQNFATQQAANSSALGGLFSLGGALGSAAILSSDRRIKTDIHKIGKLDNGLNVYRFRFKGDLKPQVGVMAQEVELVIPGAVIEIDGIKHVDYAQL